MITESDLKGADSPKGLFITSPEENMRYVKIEPHENGALVVLTLCDEDSDDEPEMAICDESNIMDIVKCMLEF